MAETKQNARAAFSLFVEKYRAECPKATKCLAKNEEQHSSFYDLPAQHWKHLRTTNPIDSTLATVGLRTRRTKGCGRRHACLAMVFKRAQSAERKWRKLNAYTLLGDAIQRLRFKDGIKVVAP